MSSRETVTVTELVAPSGISESISASTCVVAGSDGGSGAASGAGSAAGGRARALRVRRGGGGASSAATDSGRAAG